MPYSSKAQQRKMHVMASQGKISKETVEDYDKKTNFKKLPERKKKKSALSLANAMAEHISDRSKSRK